MRDIMIYRTFISFIVGFTGLTLVRGQENEWTQTYGGSDYESGNSGQQT